MNSKKSKSLKKSELSKDIYILYMEQLKTLPVVSIITTGRTGSDFLQSLLDNHEEILTFNGHLAVYSEYFNKSKVLNSKRPVVKDLVEEMVGFYLYKLVSKYEVQERKDKLGINYDESFIVDTHTFKLHMTGLLNHAELTTKNILLAFYGAYAINLNHNILRKKVFVHHPHLGFEFDFFYQDFTDCRIIFTSRDPRANFCSHVEHFRNYYKTHDNQQHLFNALEMVYEDTSIAKKYGLEFISTRLEDLPRKDIMISLAKWLSIDFDEGLLKSTWAGLDWHGDRISGKEFPSSGWSSDRTSNNWEQRLGFFDKYIFNFILNDRLLKYGYKVQKTNIIDGILVFFLILLPSKYERRFFSLNYFSYMFISGNRKNRLHYFKNAFYYFKRISLSYRYFFKRIQGVNADVRVIKAELES